MSQEVVIQIRLTLPDGATYRVTTVPEPEPRSVLDEPLPPEPNLPPYRSIIEPAPAFVPSGFTIGQVHAAGHKPLKAGAKGGMFCPTKLPDGSWCQFRA